MNKRIISLFCVLVLSLGFVCMRVVRLGAKTETSAANLQSRRVLKVSEGRATIYDRNLLPLVNKTKTYKAIVFPEIAEVSALKAVLSDEDFANAMKNYSPKVIDTGGVIINGSGIYNFAVPLRYSEDQLAPHIIGYLRDGEGVSGIERAFNDFLKNGAQSVSASYYTDGVGSLMKGENIEVSAPDTDALSGVVLTLDGRMQELVEDVLKEKVKRGAAVVMDCDTGEILAAASVPAFSPIDLSAALDSKDSPFINRAFSSYTVGSTWKLLIAAAAIESGIPVSRTYDCEHTITVEDIDFHCHWEYGHGVIDMPAALRVSCNPYFIDLGIAVGPDRILETAKNLGFGSPFELAPELYTSSGKLPKREELRSNAALASFSFGQGKLMATPVHMAALVSAFANGGYAVTPSLVRGTYDESGNFLPYTVYEKNRAMSETTAAKIREMMISVVEEGSGSLAKPETGSAGGKTASAQTGQFDPDGNETVHAWFVGFYPAEKPEYAIAVFAEGMESGGDFAAPVFKDICDGIYKLNCD